MQLVNAGVMAIAGVVVLSALAWPFFGDVPEPRLPLGTLRQAPGEPGPAGPDEVAAADGGRGRGEQDDDRDDDRDDDGEGKGRGKSGKDRDDRSGHRERERDD